jgi:hypothetical protein
MRVQRERRRASTSQPGAVEFSAARFRVSGRLSRGSVVNDPGDPHRAPVFPQIDKEQSLFIQRRVRCHDSGIASFRQ